MNLDPYEHAEETARTMETWRCPHSGGVAIHCRWCLVSFLATAYREGERDGLEKAAQMADATAAAFLRSVEFGGRDTRDMSWASHKTVVNLAEEIRTLKPLQKRDA